MAKQKGFIKLKGSLGGLTFYKNNGDDLIRTTGGVDKNRIKNDPSFKRTRENMREFGGAATVGKALRMGFATIIKSMKDNSFVGRLTGVMKQINSAGPGVRGERIFEILNQKLLLEGIEFNKNQHLDAIFYAASAAPTFNANRDVVTWVVPDFNSSDYVNAPEGATHYKLVLACTILSDYSYNAGVKKYEPSNATENEINGIAFSSELAINGMVGSDTTLTVDLGIGAALPISVGVVAAIGIVFYQEINTQFYELASDNAMRIAVVG